MATFEMARGDRLPELEVQLRDASGPVNLTTATSVTFVMAHERSGALVTGAATVVDAATGRVRYAWAEGDTDLGGYYIARFVVLFGTRAMTFPSCPERREMLVEICG